jgi:hypothetical protein
VLRSKHDSLLVMEQAQPLVSLRQGQYAKCCRRNGWPKQAQQARVFGASESYVSRLVRGQTDVTAPFIAAVMDATGMRFEDLFEITSEVDAIRAAS